MKLINVEIDDSDGEFAIVILMRCKHSGPTTSHIAKSEEFSSAPNKITFAAQSMSCRLHKVKER